MKKKMGRLICLSIAASMALSSVPFTAMAEDTLPRVVQTQTTEDETTSGDAIEVEEGKFAVYQNGETEQHESLAEAITAAQSGAVIKLGADDEVNNLDTTEKTMTFNNKLTPINALEKSLTFDLNGYVMTYSGEPITIYDENGDNNYVLEFRDSSVSDGERGGTLNLKGNDAYGSTTSVISIAKGTSLNVRNLNVKCDYTAFFPYGDASAVNIYDCDVTANGAYCIGTNAGSEENYGVEINLINSNFTVDNTVDITDYGITGDDCAVMINVRGALNIDKCNITGNRQAVVVRAGTANISNSEITVTGKYDGNNNYFSGTQWGSGNNLPAGALVAGNYQFDSSGNATAYFHNADVKILNTKITSQGATDEFPAIYVDSNGEYSSKVDITGTNTNTVVTGTVTTGQYNTAHEGNETSDINIYAGTYLTKDGSANTTLDNSYIATGNKIDESGKVIIDEENATAKIGDTGFETLEEAAGVAKDGDVIELLSDVKYGSSDGYTIPEGVTVLVPADISLTVGGLGILESKGSIEVQTGGKLLVPENVTDAESSSSDNVAFVGTDNDGTTRLILGDNSSVTINFSDGKVTLEGDATVPEGKTTYLLIGTTEKTALSLDITEGSTLKVAGRLRAVSGTGETGSVITVDGTLDASSGELDMAKKAQVDITNSGNVDISRKSFTSIIGKITVASGGNLSVAGEGWIGGQDANVYVESGSITADMTGLAGDEGDSGKVLVTIDGTATIPEGKYWTLVIGQEPLTVATDVTINEGSTLTVAKNSVEDRVDTFRITNDSTLTNNGTVVVAEGAVMAIRGDAVVSGTGKIENSGVIIYNNDGTGTGYIVNGAIVIKDSGTVYSQSDIAGIVTADEGSEVENTVTEGTVAYGGVDYTQAWQLKAETYAVSTAIADNVGGTITSTGLTADENGVFTVNAGSENVEFIISADEGYIIDTVTVDNALRTDVGENANEYTVAFETMESDHTISAAFKEAYTVTTNTEGEGTISISESEENGTGVTENEDGTYTVAEDTSISVTVTPAEGYEISSVAIDGEEVEITDTAVYKGTFTVEKDTEISATFTENEPDTPDTEPSEDPSVELSDDNGQVAVGDELDISKYVENKNIFEKITYESEGTEYATVNENGVVTGVKETDGVDIIVTGKGIASNADYTTSTAFNLEVVAKDEPTEPEEPTELSLELVENSGSVRVGREFSLASDEYIKDFDKFTAGFTYSSDDTSIATVDGNGLVKGVNRGSTTINIIANESDDYTLTTSHAAFTLNVTRSSNGEDSSSSSSGGGGGGSSSSSGYSVSTSSSDNGSFTVDKDRASSGSTVTITANPDEGYEVGKVTVTDADGNEITVRDKGNNQYTFTMPSSRVTIDVEFVESETTEEVTEPSEETTMPFTDVNENDWSYDAVKYAYENGLMSGTALDTFSPDTNTTRGMIVSILYRLEGSPAITERAAFTDVESGQYYADAVAWAAANGIVSGYDAFTFGPNDNITREQMASILYRYAQYKGIDTSAAGNLAAFSDNASISAYARTAISWAVGEGLVSGMGDGTLAPQGQATRAQVASILMRFAQM